MFGPVVIAGLGLMGGSLAAALSKLGVPVRLHARRQHTMTAAAAKGWGEAAPNFDQACADAQIVIICAPVSAIPLLARDAAAAGAQLITDVGSTKLGLQDSLADLHQQQRYIGSHPMCGSHLQGLEHADPKLYQGARIIISPQDPTGHAAQTLERLWQSVGGRVVAMDAAAHDHAVANASHLPHILSAACAGLLDDQGLTVAATGFRDTSRVAAGDSQLWADILLENKRAVADQLDQTLDQLTSLRQALIDDDQPAVLDWLQRGQHGRARFDQRG